MELNGAHVVQDNKFEDEYEYEYDQTETEVFFVDLDLSSLNGLIRPRVNSRKKLVPDLPKSADITIAPAPISSTTPATASRGLAEGSTVGLPGKSNEQSTPALRNHANKPSTAPDEGRVRSTNSAGGEIQILELHSHNPIISYQNEVYSCTWSDMIGTNMFFSDHDDETDSLRSTEDYNLLCTTRIKLIGRKAKMTEKPGSRVGQRNIGDELQDGGIDVTSGKSLGDIRFGNAAVNKDIKRQAAFLEKLMDAKRAKGETDNVRTVYKPQNLASSHTPRGPGNRKSTQRNEATQEIEELNRKVVRGDGNALMRLEEIYSELGGEENTPQSPATG